MARRTTVLAGKGKRGGLLSRMRRAVASATAGAVMLSGTVAAVSVAEVASAPAASAAAPLACDTLYALQGDSPHNIYRVDTATGTLNPEHQMSGVSGTNNALGISADGQYAFSHSGSNVNVFNTADETTESFAAGSSFNATHGAVDPSSGIYYFGNISGDTANVYAFDPASDTYLGKVAEISLSNAPGANGDWAFDSFGNLYLTAGDNVNAVYSVRGPLSTDSGTVQLEGRQISRATTDQPINGLAVDVKGYIYLSSSNKLYQVNPASGEVVATRDLTPSGESVDLASCATPATVMVQKDVVDRRNPTDQFEVSVTGGGIPDDVAGNKGTTEGDDTGVQDGTNEVGGPLMVLAGETYTVTEKAAGTTDLANYTTSWECVNQIDDSVIASGEGTEGQFTMPVATAGGIGAAVVCTFSNEDLPQPGLKITKTAEPSGEVLPGDRVDYTVTVENTGETPYDAANPATFTDDLTQVLDDATYNDDGAASAGTVSYAEPNLSWSGPLGIGDTATITYSVTVNDPLSGDGKLVNAVTGPPESNCVEGTEPDCTTVVPVKALEITKTADPSDESTPGSTVDYTITVKNTGQVPYTADAPATFTDDLSEVLDDATYNDDAAADIGTASYSAPNLSWSGPLEPGQTATITYSVTVNDPPTGDGSLDNGVVGPPESNCDDGTEDECHIVLPDRSLAISKTADPTDEVLPGETVNYTVTVENTGQVPYTANRPATFTDDLTEVLDDATYNNDGAASAGTVSYAAPKLSWSGPLAPGATATITYSVTVNDPVSGDGELTNAVTGPPESNCDRGTEPECTIDVPVKALAITKKASPKVAVRPGATVTYTVTVKNTGQVPYTAAAPATFTDDLSEVLDDATYNDDATADVGEVTFASPEMSWSGPLRPGQTATITYSVTVNDPPTGDGRLDNAVVGPAESNCDRGTEPDCTVSVPVRELEIVKTSSPDGPVNPGDTVSYTVKVTNTGDFPFGPVFPARFTDDLAEVLDDATYNNDATADIGEVSYSDGTVSWRSDRLAPGQTATVTYSVTVNDPRTGDGVLTNTVVGPPVSNCDDETGRKRTAATEDDCSTTVPVRSFEVSKRTDAAGEVAPGDVVNYVVTVRNTGEAAYTADDPASFTDDLSEVLDDATYNGDATASAGEVSFTEPSLTWTGPLEVGGTVTVAYSVTIDDPDRGDGEITNVVTADGEKGGYCRDHDDRNCTTTAKITTPGEPGPPAKGSADLPFTGAPLAVLLLGAGLLLLIVGAPLALAARRRRRA